MGQQRQSLSELEHIIEWKREMLYSICFKITRLDPKKGVQVVSEEVLLKRQVDARSDPMRVFLSLVVKTRTQDSQD
jgi:hypothetical protein